MHGKSAKTDKTRGEEKQRTSKASKSPKAVMKKSSKLGAKAAAKRATPLIKPHRRVTVYRATPTAIMGMHANSKITHAGSTSHFDVSYVTALGQKGASLAQAILQHCERDYSTLQEIFSGLTPQRLPFVVQITSGATGASHSSSKSGS